MADTNIHGLSRASLSAEVKRQVRRRSGFGCVVCGNALYEYEHFDPEFKDATSHVAEGITLLCPGCHAKKGTFLSREAIRAAMLQPAALITGFSFGAFDAGTNPDVRLGTLRARNTPVLLQINGEEVLGLRAPEEAGGPFRINASFRDRDGLPTLEIVDNEWRTSSDVWDATVVGSVITIRRKHRDLALILRAKPGAGIDVERLEMQHRGVQISVRKGQDVKIRLPNGSELTSGGIFAQNADALLSLEGSDVKVGGGGGATWIESMTMRSPGIQQTRKVGRNELCPCGSGVKFKKCHGGNKL